MQEDNKQIRILLRLASNGKVCSLLAPGLWTIKKLRNFIGHAFKEEVKTNTVTLYHGAKQLVDDNLYIFDLLKQDRLMVQIIVMFKPKENLSEILKSSLQISILPDESKKKEILNTDEFEKVEMYLYHSYKEVIKSNYSPLYDFSLLKDLKELKAQNQMINKFPMMHNNIQHRLKSVNEKNKLTKPESFDPENVEPYPFRDYFKVEVFFKLFLFFILFGSHVKGYNIPFFISMLIVYYWYCLYTDMTAYYDKKINEFKLTAEQKKELNFLDDEDVVKDFENEEEGEEHYEQDESEENSLHQEDTVQQTTEKEDINRQTEVNVDGLSDEKHGKDDKDDKDDNLNLERDYFDRDNKIQSDSKIDDIEIEDIKNSDNEILDARGKYFAETQNLENKENLLNKIQIANRKTSSVEKEFVQEINPINITNKIENKKSRHKEKKRESLFKYYLLFTIDSMYTFVMSALPMWCDDFELHNPLIQRIQAPVENPNTNMINNREIEMTNIIQDENNIIREIHDENQINSDIQQEMMDELHQQMREQIQQIEEQEMNPHEDKNLHDKHPEFKSQISKLSEKILIKSSNNDTRNVNHSEDQNPKFFLVEENENRTENEFVFSENVNIDTLSYNEPIIESLRKKNDDEVEHKS